MRDRRPSVSNAFYEGTPESLEEQMKWCFMHGVGPGALPVKATSSMRTICAIISPHAGYVYSGPVAAHGFLALSKEPPPKTVVLFGPNHTGMGAGVSIWDGGDWITPLGRVQVDLQLAKSISRSGVAELDEMAHLHEHSIEVQIPFLQFIYGSSFKIVPVCMMMQDFATSGEVGLAVAEALRGSSCLIVASTDFSHYVPYRVAYAKDALVGSAIERMDARAVGETVDREGISMCGPGPVMAAITAAQALGAKSCKKLCYATSGDTSGSKGDVVGYGSFMISL